MDVNPGTRLHEVKQQLEARAGLMTEQVGVADRLKADAYRLEYLQACVDELAAEIESAENPGFLGAFQNLFSNPQDRIERLREQQYELQQQVAELTKSVESMQRRLEDIRSRIDAAGDAESEYAALLAGAEQAILNRGDDKTAALQSLVQHQTAVRQQADKARMTLECAEAALQRVDNMSRALSRTRKKRLPAVDVVGGVWNAAQAQAARPAVQRVHQGIEELHRRLSELDASGGTDADVELVRLTGAMEGLCVQLASGRIGSAVRDRRATFPIEDDVRQVVDAVQEKIAALQAELDRLEREKQSLIESTA